MKKGRSASREVALRLLYQFELTKARKLKLDGSDDFQDDFEPETRQNGVNLANRVSDVQQELDVLIERFAIDWSLDRISHVDKAVLRIGFFELLYTHTDPAVIINEAVELAKYYSTDEAPSFVNGILGRYVDLECSQDSSKD